MTDEKDNVVQEEAVEVVAPKDTEPDEMEMEKVSGVAYDNVGEYDEALTSPKDMDAWINVYNVDVWVNAGVNAINRVISSLEMKLVEENKVNGVWEKSFVDDHPFLDLIKKPNPNDTQYDLFEALSIYLDMVGTGYWEIVYDDDDMPVELWNIRPSRLAPIPDKDGRSIKNYVFQTKKYGKKTPFEPDEIVPFKYFNPLSDWIGEGSVQPAIDEIQLEAQMIKWNKGFFKKGTIEGILRTNKPLTGKDIRDVTTQWSEMRSRQGRSTPVVTKGLEYQSLGSNPQEAEFLKGRTDNRISILAALGVPPAKVGLLDNAQYDNLKMQEESFNKGTIIPRCYKIAGAITNHLLPHYPDLQTTETKRYHAEFDTKELTKEDEDRLTKRLTEQVRHGGITPNEMRVRTHGIKSDDPNSDKLYIDKRLVLLGDVDSDESDPQGDRNFNDVDRIGDDGMDLDNKYGEQGT